MDITACPYNRYFTELGVPELTKIFCINDECAYGDIPGLEFIRTQTLGKGGEKCDFLYSGQEVSSEQIKTQGAIETDLKLYL